MTVTMFGYLILINIDGYDFISSLFILSLKEQCHGDFAVLGQFCVKIITLRPGSDAVLHMSRIECK